jgi:hypothetical protein
MPYLDQKNRGDPDLYFSLLPAIAKDICKFFVPALAKSQEGLGFA